MSPPRPAAVRLLTRVPGTRPRPPWGLAEWAAEAEAIAVLLDASTADLHDPAQLAAQIPPADELPPSTPLFVLGAAIRRGGLIRRMGFGEVAVPRAPRCTALVARGYVGIGAGVEPASGADLAWGYSVLSSPC